jgi:hypothetical protein
MLEEMPFLPALLTLYTLDFCYLLNLLVLCPTFGPIFGLIFGLFLAASRHYSRPYSLSHFNAVPFAMVNQVYEHVHSGLDRALSKNLVITTITCNKRHACNPLNCTAAKAPRGKDSATYSNEKVQPNHFGRVHLTSCRLTAAPPRSIAAYKTIQRIRSFVGVVSFS